MAWFYRRSAKQATAVAAAALSESTPAAIGIRTGVRDVEDGVAESGPFGADQDGDAVAGDDVVDRDGGRIGGHREELPAVQRLQLVGEVLRAGVGERERRAHGDAQRSPGQRVGARVVEDQPVEAERSGVADDRADVGRVVDRLEHDQPGRARCEGGHTRACGALEQRHDRVRVPEPGDEATDLDAARRRPGRGGCRRGAERARCRRVPPRERIPTPAPVRSPGHPRRRTARRRRRRASRCDWRAPARSAGTAGTADRPGPRSE